MEAEIGKHTKITGYLNHRGKSGTELSIVINIIHQVNKRNLYIKFLRLF
jgi:hypothetical protein